MDPVNLIERANKLTIATTEGIATDIIARTWQHPSSVWPIAVQTRVHEAGSLQRDPSPIHEESLGAGDLIAVSSRDQPARFVQSSLVPASRRGRLSISLQVSRCGLG